MSDAEVIRAYQQGVREGLRQLEAELDDMWEHNAATGDISLTYERFCIAYRQARLVREQNT